MYIDGLVQERRNPIANALVLRLSCTNPSIYETLSQDGQIMAKESWPNNGIQSLTMNSIINHEFNH